MTWTLGSFAAKTNFVATLISENIGRDFITLIIQGWLYEFQTIAMVIVIDK